MKRRRPVPQSERVMYEAHKEHARSRVLAMIDDVNSVYNLPIGSVRIKAVKTRWASCSSLGNLNFSHKVAYVSDEVLNYLVAHELSHLVHFNHSKAFWDHVEIVVPNYKEVLGALREYERSLIDPRAHVLWKK